MADETVNIGPLADFIMNRREMYKDVEDPQRFQGNRFETIAPNVQEEFSISEINQIIPDSTIENIKLVNPGGAGGVTWTTQSSDVTMQSDVGYVTTSGSLVTLTLPTGAFGDEIWVAGYGSGGWQIAQPASFSIIFGNQTTTTGTGGYLASINRYDKVHLVCYDATTWMVLSSLGNITLV